MKPTITTSIIIVLIVLFGIFSLGYIGKGGTAASVQGVKELNTSNSLLSTTEALYDFGKISMANGKVERIFNISNLTESEVMVKSIETSCMCTAVYIETNSGEKGPFGMSGHGGSVPIVNEIIKSKGAMNIRVVYDPNAHGPAGIGQIDRFVTIEDASGGQLQLEIKAIVTP